MNAVRVHLPTHLRQLAGCEREITVEVDDAAPATQRNVLDAIEARYPQLLGMMRDRRSGQRRAYVRFYACEQDLSHEPPDDPLPAAVAEGREPLLVIGAMAGG